MGVRDEGVRALWVSGRAGVLLVGFYRCMVRDLGLGVLRDQPAQVVNPNPRKNHQTSNALGVRFQTPKLLNS